uniref:Uncharacterized protein n=1 Tax=Colobus angolensis palliatus TaxID=336983 RepID=A0A2K5HRP1_COLAP
MVLAGAAKMRSPRVRMAPNPVPDALIRRRKLGCRQEGRVKTEAETGGQGVPGVARATTGCERCGTDSLSHRRAQACTRWLFLRPKLPVRLQPLEMATDTFVLGLSPGWRGLHTREPFRNNE